MIPVRLHLELPPGWQAVALPGSGDTGGSTELTAVRTAGPGETFTPNLTAATHRVPVALPVLTYADRVLGRMSLLAERVAVFKNAAESTGDGTPGTLDSVVVRGLRLITRPEAGDGARQLVQFQVHAGVAAAPGAAEYQVAQLVLTCASHQRELVEPEFQSVVDNFGVEPATGAWSPAGSSSGGGEG